MPPSVEAWLLNSGPLGVATLVLSGVVVKLYRDNQRVRDNERKALLRLLGDSPPESFGE